MTISKTAQNLLEEINEATENAPVAALAADFKNREGWAELVETAMVNVWEDDTETEYVEAGRQQ